MADEPETESSSVRSQSMRWDDTPSLSSAVLPRDETESASVSGRHTPTGTKAPQQQKGPPSWWDPPPRVHVDQRYKDQVRLSRGWGCFMGLGVFRGAGDVSWGWGWFSTAVILCNTVKLAECYFELAHWECV